MRATPALAGGDQQILNFLGARQDSQRFGNADDGDLPAVGDQIDALGTQLMRAESERPETGTQAPQLAQHPRAVLIS